MSNGALKKWGWSRRKAFFIRLTSWEYWPVDLIYAPVYIWIFLLALRFRSFFFFTATNPGIEFGGLFGESKYGLLKQIDDEFKAQTVFVPSGISRAELNRLASEGGFTYPLIAKPDVGEKGLLVKVIESEEELWQFISQCKIDFLLQEFIAEGEEFSVLYLRSPKGDLDGIFSLTSKRFLTLTGDGKSTIRELIFQDKRAYLQFPRIINRGVDVEQVLKDGEEKVIGKIGNHRLGTEFLDGEFLKSQKLEELFGEITERLEGAHFVRYDLKCPSQKDFTEGKNIKIIEVNGVGAEPAHIYDPRYSWFYALRTLFAHWSRAYRIARQNRPATLSFQEGMAWNKRIKEYRKITRPLHDF